MRLVRALPGGFSSIKEHIRQEVADIISDIKLLKDITDFSDALKTYFKDNGHLQLFTTTIVPPLNKSDRESRRIGNSSFYMIGSFQVTKAMVFPD